MPAMFRSLTIAVYRRYFFGALVSNVGTWMDRIALDWLVLAILTDNDAFALGVAMALQFAPVLILSPLSGAVADRLDRRVLLLITQSTVAVSSGVLGAVTLSGLATLPIVYCFALFSGIIAAFDAPARQAVLGELVPPQHLANAVSLNSSSFNAARMVGPAIAGVLIALIGPGWVFWLNTLSSLSILLVLVSLVHATRAERATRPRTRARVRDGLSYLRTRPDILVIYALVFVCGAFALNFPIFIAAMARIEFDADAAVFGALSSAIAVGSVAGGLAAARRERPRLRIITGAAALFGVSLGVAAIMPGIWSFGIALIPAGFFSLTMLTSANAYVQTTTAPELRGRVMSFYMSILMGATPIGAPIIGWIAHNSPRESVVAGMAAALFAAAIPAVWYWNRIRLARKSLNRMRPRSRNSNEQFSAAAA